jgi:hypothetical protein
MELLGVGVGWLCGMDEGKGGTVAFSLVSSTCSAFGIQVMGMGFEFGGVRRCSAVVARRRRRESAHREKNSSDRQIRCGQLGS